MVGRPLSDNHLANSKLLEAIGSKAMADLIPNDQFLISLRLIGARSTGERASLLCYSHAF
jgi:hypothetical protein